MPYAAITYKVKPGHEDEIAAIFAAFERVDTPDFAGETGDAAGRLLGTAVFVKDENIVRVIHYEGDFAAVGRHMSTQKGVHVLEEKLAPFLAEQRDTAAPQDFAEYFRKAIMRSVQQLTVDTHPVGAPAS
ncbi:MULTISPECIES: SchA/CurD-like domain-containing protein [unclassified Streptomyces]|uniref:SchA/CurD-like domain-containing protein n=1 Tax=Streptomyces TaxID=1883 RepID=UPI000DC795D1|nr:MULTISPECIES: SchA/CurD-like domain-containing protein [unclassified Streptomyces]AWZ04423.1 SchA/CurD [Streptomyces sp. ICC4]AWZ12061.1 SchA/CurD [Streptomyces sp. ICC1]